MNRLIKLRNAQRKEQLAVRVEPKGKTASIRENADANPVVYAANAIWGRL